MSRCLHLISPVNKIGKTMKKILLSHMYKSWHAIVKIESKYFCKITLTHSHHPQTYTSHHHHPQKYIYSVFEVYYFSIQRQYRSHFPIVYFHFKLMFDWNLENLFVFVIVFGNYNNNDNSNFFPLPSSRVLFSQFVEVCLLCCL